MPDNYSLLKNQPKLQENQLSSAFFFTTIRLKNVYNCSSHTSQLSLKRLIYKNGGELKSDHALFSFFNDDIIVCLTALMLVLTNGSLPVQCIYTRQNRQSDFLRQKCSHKCYEQKQYIGKNWYKNVKCSSES